LSASGSAPFRFHNVSREQPEDVKPENRQYQSQREYQPPIFIRVRQWLTRDQDARRNVYEHGAFGTDVFLSGAGSATLCSGLDLGHRRR